VRAGKSNISYTNSIYCQLYNNNNCSRHLTGLMKSRPTSLLSSRDKMPFEVTPMVPYLTRYVETSSSQESSRLFAALN
jgi:hypothetical protein